MEKTKRKDVVSLGAHASIVCRLAPRLARRTSAPTTACERSTHPAPSSTSPSRCTPAPRRHPGPTTAPAETTQNGPTAVSGARRARGWTDAVGSTRARVAGGEASPRVPRTRDACGRVASRAARTSARDRHAISSVGSSRRLPREKATFLVVRLTGRARAVPSGVERSSRARVRYRFVCVWEIFRGIIERGSRVTDGGMSFFRHVRREKIEAPTP